MCGGKWSYSHKLGCKKFDGYDTRHNKHITGCSRSSKNQNNVESVVLKGGRQKKSKKDTGLILGNNCYKHALNEEFIVHIDTHFIRNQRSSIMYNLVLEIKIRG